MSLSFGPDTAHSLGPFLTPIPPQVWLRSGTSELGVEWSPFGSLGNRTHRRGLRQDETAPVWSEVSGMLASQVLVH